MAVTVAVAGCSSSSSGGSSNGGSGSDKGTTITYWAWKDDAKSTVYETLAGQFEKETGIHVKLSLGTAYADFYQSLVNAVAAGNAPDATELNSNGLGQLSASHALASLNDQINSWQGQQAVTPTLWNFVESADGKTKYAVPFKYLMFLLLYRKDLLQAAGVTVPKTQEEFVAAVKAVTEHGGKHYGFDLRGSNGVDQWGSFTVAGGARFVDNNGKVVFDSDPARTANKLYISTYPYCTPGCINTSSGSTLVQELQSGTAAMIINHIGGARLLTDKTNVGAAPVPSVSGDPSNTTYQGTMNMNGIIASSKHKDAAFKWISWLAQPEAQLAVAKSTEGYIPVVTSVTQDPQFKDDPFMQASLLMTKNAPIAWPPLPGTAKATSQTWPPLFQGALLGKNSPDAVVKGMADALGAQQ
jgi:multiple sugar transport system substrate-binding protein